MRGILQYTTEAGHTRSLISLYVLHSLHCKPKTGYDLLKEIEEVTGGAWMPSKGTLYPLLHSLAGEGLITQEETGVRSKTIYRLTDAGEEVLTAIKACRHQSKEHVLLLKTIHTRIFGKERASLREMMWEIRESIHDLPPEKHEDALEILRRCRKELEELSDETIP